jgi:predicted DNA binding CopG/RHH family protein
MMTKLTPEEQEIVTYIEQQHPPSIANIDSEKARFMKVAQQQINKKKAISIRLVDSDIERMKAKSIEQGIPYQTIISTLVHQYVTGKIQITL